jgi:hypothetical protein
MNSQTNKYDYKKTEFDPISFFIEIISLFVPYDNYYNNDNTRKYGGQGFVEHTICNKERKGEEKYVEHSSPETVFVIIRDFAYGAFLGCIIVAIFLYFF